MNEAPAAPSFPWFVERMGLAAETDGLPRIAGRVFGTLLLSAEPLSLDELTTTLGVSKASVSTDARRLLESGVIERVGRPGDRRDYYQIATDFFTRLISYRVSRWIALRDLVREMNATAPDQPPAVRERFAYLEDIHEFVRLRVEAALDEWHELHRDR
jgi:DNA-binding transcriptional regulator GbsR (MarR family)